MLQDIGPDEFLINYAGPVDDPRFADTSDWNDLAYDFYCHFSQQCYITDFEISVKFDSRSDPAERLVVGLGGGKVSGEMRRYPKVSKLATMLVTSLLTKDFLL